MILISYSDHSQNINIYRAVTIFNSTEHIFHFIFRSYSYFTTYREPSFSQNNVFVGKDELVPLLSGLNKIDTNDAVAY